MLLQGQQKTSFEKIFRGSEASVILCPTPFEILSRMMSNVSTQPLPRPFPSIGNWCSQPAVPVSLHGRCNASVCYSPKTLASGHRTFGRFTSDADSLAAAVLNQVSSEDAEAPESWEGALFRWLRDSDRRDDEVTILPSEWRGIESAVEQVFLAGKARVFCLCCNRTFERNASRLELRSPMTGQGHRYLCPRGHLLLETAAQDYVALASIAA